ncbi:uncharacterized protein V6R79_000604 [Siganus canaliculatus]
MQVRCGATGWTSDDESSSCVSVSSVNTDNDMQLWLTPRSDAASGSVSHCSGVIRAWKREDRGRPPPHPHPYEQPSLPVTVNVKHRIFPAPTGMLLQQNPFPEGPGSNSGFLPIHAGPIESADYLPMAELIFVSSNYLQPDPVVSLCMTPPTKTSQNTDKQKCHSNLC